MPPSATLVTVSSAAPVKLPASASWWVMLGTLTTLLLAGHTLRPQALAQATASHQPRPAPAIRPRQSPVAPPQLLRAGSLAARTASEPTSF